MHSNFSRRIKTDGSQILSVPNTEEGLYFLHLLSKYTNQKRYVFKKKGRGGGEHYRKVGGDTPLEHAKWFALYLNKKPYDMFKRGTLAVVGKKLEKLINIDNKQMRLV